MPAPLLRYDSAYDAPYFDGSPSATDLVPGIYHIAIDGHPYMLDLSRKDVPSMDGWAREETKDQLRPQSDQSDELGEQSLSPEQTWRRSASTWHKGAGQDHLDRPGSDQDRARFRSSKGVDPWTRWELSLLEDTEKVDNFSGGSGSSLLVVNPSGTARAYTSSGGNNLRTSPDPLSVWTAVGGIPGSNCTSLCTDGVNVYSAWGTNRVYITDAAGGPTAAAAFVTSGNPVSLVAYVKGRLLAAHNNNLYEITGSGALPAPLFTHVTAAWVWVGFAEGNGFIYAAGNAGAQGNVYKIAVEKETTALGKPAAAIAGLPPGETIHSIHGALGFVFLGTSRGVRFCVPTQNGDLNVGSLIPTGAAVRCFTTWDRFTWFGWSNYDGNSTGLGRLDPSVVNDESGALVPAYASDVMATTSGVVNAVAILPSAGDHAHPVFAVDTSGVWRCIADKPVASGELRTGLISYGIPDTKLAAFLDPRHSPLPDGTSINFALIGDDQVETGIGISSSPGSVGPGPLNGSQKRAELFELMFTLNGKTTVTYATPTLRRWTLRAIPVPPQPSSWVFPLLFQETVFTDHDIALPFNPLAEEAFLRSLRDTKRIVTLRWGLESVPVVVDGITWLFDRNTGAETVPNYAWTGTLYVKLSQVTG